MCLQFSSFVTHHFFNVIVVFGANVWSVISQYTDQFLSCHGCCLHQFIAIQQWQHKKWWKAITSSQFYTFLFLPILPIKLFISVECMIQLISSHRPSFALLPPPLTCRHLFQLWTGMKCHKFKAYVWECANCFVFHDHTIHSILVHSQIGTMLPLPPNQFYCPGLPILKEVKNPFLLIILSLFSLAIIFNPSAVYSVAIFTAVTSQYAAITTKNALTAQLLTTCLTFNKLIFQGMISLAVI